MDINSDNDEEQIVSSTTSALLYKKRKNEISDQTQNKKKRNLNEFEKNSNDLLKLEALISNACHVMKNPINDIKQFEKSELILIVIAYSNICLEDLTNWNEFFTKICRYDWTIKIRYALSKYFIKCPCISALLKNNRELKNIQSEQVFYSDFDEIYLNKIKRALLKYNPNITDQQEKRQCINLKKTIKK